MFLWSPVADATAYNLHLVVNGNPQPAIRWTSISFTREFSSESGTLVEWAVQATAGSNAGPFSATRTFTISDPPTPTPTPGPPTATPTPFPTLDKLPAPTLLEPPNQTRFSPERFNEGIELRWTAVEGASQYRVSSIVQQDGQFIPQPSVLTQATQHMLSLAIQDGAWFQWAVAALDGSGIAGEKSSDWTILADTSVTPTPTPPGGGGLSAPALLEPADGFAAVIPRGATLAVQFAWEAVPGAAQYRFRLQESAGEPVEFDFPLPAFPFTFVSVDRDRVFEWSVFALDGSGAPGEESERRQLTLFGPPAPIPGDLDGNSTVDVLDLFLIASAFGRGPDDGGFVPAADLDGNQIIDADDLLLFVINFQTAN